MDSIFSLKQQLDQERKNNQELKKSNEKLIAINKKLLTEIEAEKRKSNLPQELKSKLTDLLRFIEDMDGNGKLKKIFVIF